MTVANMIEERIMSSEAGTAFVPSDFHDIASVDNANAALSRLTRRGVIMRAMRGVYARPRHSEILNLDAPPSPDTVAHAIARSNRWVIAPAGNTALNSLGLDTQVPAIYEYVSTGPYKSYLYMGIRISMKHRADRDLLDCSPLTRLVIQALKALGKDAVDDDLVGRIARRLSDEEAIALWEETRGTTAWVFEFAKRVRRKKGC